MVSEVVYWEIFVIFARFIAYTRVMRAKQTQQKLNYNNIN